MILKLNSQILGVDAGELVGYEVDGHQYIHQKGSPGWRSSDTEMFPIIGPTAAAGFKVQTPKGIAIQDQHGLLREMEYELIRQSETEATYRKRYKAKTRVKNSKYPNKSTEEYLYWPYDFQFEKKFKLTENGLEITFKITGDKDMPFMLGYHPAFNLVTSNPTILANDNEITLQKVLDVGSRAMKIIACDTIILKDKNELHVQTEGFGNFMLWTEVSNMICIEPISFYPYAVEPQFLNEGFQVLDEKQKIFKVHIAVHS